MQVELTDALRKAALGRRASRRRKGNSSSLALSPLTRLLGPLYTAATTVSLRHAIIPTEGNLLLSADYSQIELRILAHLSGDQALGSTLRQGGDVFRNIAAQIHRCSLDRVTDTQRQQAKQAVYRVIYGMGEKALGDQLGMEPAEAEAREPNTDFLWKIPLVTVHRGRGFSYRFAPFLPRNDGLQVRASQ